MKIKGLEIESDRCLFRGSFRNNLKEGFGEMIYADSSTYSGGWSQDKFQGQGIFVNKEGDTYQGTFYASQKSGLGTELFTNGDSFTGNFQRNLFHNYGSVTLTKVSIHGKTVLFIEDNFLKGKCMAKATGSPAMEIIMLDNTAEG